MDVASIKTKNIKRLQIGAATAMIFIVSVLAKMTLKIRDDVRFMEHETFIVSLDIVEHGPYNPDLDV